MDMDHRKTCRRLDASVAVGLMCVAPCSSTKTLIDHFQPIPTVGKLSTTVWGAAAVGPRDPSNGIEDPDNYFYWDGKIIKAPDRKYHLFASRWPKSSGVPGWECCSVSVHATSDNASAITGPFNYAGSIS